MLRPLLPYKVKRPFKPIAVIHTDLILLLGGFCLLGGIFGRFCVLAEHKIVNELWQAHCSVGSCRNHSKLYVVNLAEHGFLLSSDGFGI